MPELDLLALLMRWTHIATAIIAIGGAFFMRFVLIPTAERHLSNEEHDRLKASLIVRWSRFVHSCIALFLISGFYNFFLRLGAGKEGAYHILFGIKFLLSFGVMFLAFILSSQRSWAASFRAQSSKWLTILLSMAAVIVLLAGVMKTM